eukprot:3965609-Prymnesium_polylepis.1
MEAAAAARPKRGAVVSDGTGGEREAQCVPRRIFQRGAEGGEAAAGRAAGAQGAEAAGGGEDGVEQSPGGGACACAEEEEADGHPFEAPHNIRRRAR